MIDATRLGGVVDDRAAGSAELVVEADACGEREQPGRDPGEEVAWCARPVRFEREQVLAGVEDRLDALTDGCEVDAVIGLAATRWTDDARSQSGECRCELVAGIAFVADDRLSA